MFVFIAGASLVFSLSKTIAASGKGAAVRRIAFRSIALFLLGILSYGGMANKWPGIRIAGVLQRIAICYMVAALLFTFFRPRTLAIVAVSLLLLYWGLMALMPVPGVGRGNFAERMNLADYIDKQALPGRKWDKDHDPEGILSTLPAIASCLLGVFAGLLLRNGGVPPWKKSAILILAGTASVALGMAWGGMFPGSPHLAFLSPLKFPVVKKIWTSSFVLVAGGYSAAVLGLFYLVVDIGKLRFWALPFRWIGMNAITLYMLHGLFRFDKFADKFVGGNVAHWLGRYDEVARTGVALIFVLLLARFLYRRSIFLRL
jgi:predicted acyltransferase